MGSSSTRRRERPATPEEPLPAGVEDSVPPPPLRRSRRVATTNPSTRDAAAGPGVDGAAPPAPSRRSKRLNALKNPSARDAQPSATGDHPEVSEFPFRSLVASDGSDLISFSDKLINIANELINFFNELINKTTCSSIPIVPSPGPF